MIFHKSNYGVFGNAFSESLGGFVATTGDEVLKLDWPYDLTEEEADGIAAGNREILKEVEGALAVWRGEQRNKERAANKAFGAGEETE